MYIYNKFCVMCGVTCCVEIMATVYGKCGFDNGDIKGYLKEKYQVEGLCISDIIFSKKTENTHFILTYTTYYEEDVLYYYYDFVQNKKEELYDKYVIEFQKLDLDIDDIDISIF